LSGVKKMASIVRTNRVESMEAEQLLATNWTYVGAILLESENLRQQSQHRVLTQWQGDQGEELSFILNFNCWSASAEPVITPSSRCRPQIDRRLTVIDPFGFEILPESLRELEWDLLMSLNLEPVTADLKQRLIGKTKTQRS